MSSIVPMEYYKFPTLLLRVVVALVIVLSITQAAPLGFGGMAGPGGFGMHRMMSNLRQQQKQQSSGQSRSMKYRLDEEEAGYFRGEWVSNSTRLYDRSKAQLKRTECPSRIPPEWKVEYFLNHTSAEEDDKNSTVPPSVAPSSTPFPLLGRKKRFLLIPGPGTPSPCITNRSIKVIRDERKDRVEQFPLSTSFTANGVLMRVNSEEVFGDGGYPQSKEVVWQIELPESRRVVIIFQSFELDRSSPCGDYISIHNENGDLRKFCAQETLEDIVQSIDYIVGKRITLKFVASAGGNGVGFSALLI